MGIIGAIASRPFDTRTTVFLLGALGLIATATIIASNRIDRPWTRGRSLAQFAGEMGIFVGLGFAVWLGARMVDVRIQHGYLWLPVLGVIIGFSASRYFSPWKWAGAHWVKWFLACRTKADVQKAFDEIRNTNPFFQQPAAVPLYVEMLRPVFRMPYDHKYLGMSSVIGEEGERLLEEEILSHGQASIWPILESYRRDPWPSKLGLLGKLKRFPDARDAVFELLAKSVAAGERVEFSLRELGRLGDWRATSIICECLSREENHIGWDDIKEAAISALGELGDPGAISTLLRIAKENIGPGNIWETALAAIARCKDASALPGLIQLLNDPHKSVKTMEVMKAILVADGGNAADEDMRRLAGHADVSQMQKYYIDQSIDLPDDASDALVEQLNMGPIGASYRPIPLDISATRDLARKELARRESSKTGTVAEAKAKLAALVIFCSSIHALAAVDGESDERERLFLKRVIPVDSIIVQGQLDHRKHGLEHLLKQVRSELNEAQQRCLMANLIAVALEDGLLRPSEEEILEKFRAALNIPDADYRQVHAVLLQKANLSVFADDGGGEVPALILFCASLKGLAGTDGNGDETEQEYIERLIGNTDTIKAGSDYLERVGIDHVIEKTGAHLNDEQKQCLLSNLMDLSIADGTIRPDELELTSRFRLALGMTEENYSAILKAFIELKSYSVFN